MCRTQHTQPEHFEHVNFDTVLRKRDFFKKEKQKHNNKKTKQNKTKTSKKLRKLEMDWAEGERK